MSSLPNQTNRTQESGLVSINIYNGATDAASRRRRRLQADDGKIDFQSDVCNAYKIHIQVSNISKYIIDIDLGKATPFPSCDFWNVDNQQWDAENCFVHAIDEKNGIVTCGCPHLTTFSIAGHEIIPEATLLTELDFHQFTISNLIEYPTVWITLIIIFIVIGFICWLDPRSRDIETASILAFEDSIYTSFQRKRLFEDIIGKEMKIVSEYMPNHHLVGAGFRNILTGDDGSVESLCVFQLALFGAYVRNDHTLISLFSRTSGTNLTLKQRLGCFSMYLFTVMVVTAIFYGETQPTIAQEITQSFITSLFATVPQFIIKKIFEKSKPIEIRSRKEAVDQMASLLSGFAKEDLDKTQEDNYSSSDDEEGPADLRLLAVKTNADRYPNMKEFNQATDVLYNLTDKEEGESERLLRAKHIRRALFDGMFPLPHKFKKIAWIILIAWSIFAAILCIVYGLRFDLQYDRIENKNISSEYSEPCWHEELSKTIQMDESLRLADEKQSVLDDINESTYGGGQSKSWILSIFQSLLTSLILWQPLTIYVITWIKIWAFTWHLKMKIGPGNIIALCKKCCHRDSDNGDITIATTNSEEFLDIDDETSSVNKTIAYLIAHDGRPVEPNSFLGNPHLIIDDVGERKKTLKLQGGPEKTLKDSQEIYFSAKELAVIGEVQKEREENDADADDDDDNFQIEMQILDHVNDGDDVKEEEEEEEDQEPPSIKEQTTISMADEFVQDYMAKEAHDDSDSVGLCEEEPDLYSGDVNNNDKQKNEDDFDIEYTLSSKRDAGSGDDNELSDINTLDEMANLLTKVNK